mmetsp:Transcript_78021/g.200908  ORF Transcript_78021/g.200908 Transcript_78021/m.200908 type:complete len:267 (+) Transcript_78021:752-1552(+)
MASSSSFLATRYSPFSLPRISLASLSIAATSAACCVFSAISFLRAAISLSSFVTASVSSSMVREVLAAVRVSLARSASHVSLCSKSLTSSSLRTSSMESMASMTSVKWLLPAASFVARSDRRTSAALRPASRSASAAETARRWLAAVLRPTWRNTADWSCDAKDFLKRSRASSLWRIEIALLMAASSPTRSCLRSFHSSFLSASASLTCWTYVLSLPTCAVSLSISAVESALDMPLAPFSPASSLSASWALDSSPVLLPMSLSKVV